VTEALEIEQKSKLDFVGALNRVHVTVSTRVGEIMLLERVGERRIKKEEKDV